MSCNAITYQVDEPFLIWDILEAEIPRQLLPNISSLLSLASTCNRLYSACQSFLPLVAEIPEIKNPRRLMTNEDLLRFPNILSLHLGKSGLTNDAFGHLNQLTSLNLDRGSSQIDDEIFAHLVNLRYLEIADHSHHISFANDIIGTPRRRSCHCGGIKEVTLANLRELEQLIIKTNVEILYRCNLPFTLVKADAMLKKDEMPY